MLLRSNKRRRAISETPFDSPADVSGWVDTTQNSFVGDAAALWKATIPNEEDQSRCICKPEDGCRDSCHNRSMLYECDDSNCVTGVKHCTNRLFTSLQKRIESDHTYIGVERFLSADRGYGIRSTRRFEPNQIILEYIGEIITKEECDRRIQNEYRDNQCHYLMSLRHDLVIDATTKGNIARFVNHSCQPNCKMIPWIVSGEPRVGLFAGDRPIAVGEELTFDYKFEPFAKSMQKCLCGSPKCRGVLGRPRPTASGSSQKPSGLKRQCDAYGASKERKRKRTGKSHSSMRAINGESSGAPSAKLQPKVLKSFEWRDTRISEWDCVAVRRKQGEDYARILEIQEKEDQIDLRIVWFYTREELYERFGIKEPYHGKYELFLSNHKDVIGPEHLEGKVQVDLWDTRQDRILQHFYVRQHIDINIKNKKKKLTFLHPPARHCCCGQYENPDVEMIQCPNCLKWLFPNCLRGSHCPCCASKINTQTLEDRIVAPFNDTADAATTGTKASSRPPMEEQHHSNGDLKRVPHTADHQAMVDEAQGRELIEDQPQMLEIPGSLISTDMKEYIDTRHQRFIQAGSSNSQKGPGYGSHQDRVRPENSEDEFDKIIYVEGGSSSVLTSPRSSPPFLEPAVLPNHVRKRKNTEEGQQSGAGQPKIRVMAERNSAKMNMVQLPTSRYEVGNLNANTAKDDKARYLEEIETLRDQVQHEKATTQRLKYDLDQVKERHAIELQNEQKINAAHTESSKWLCRKVRKLEAADEERQEDVKRLERLLDGQIQLGARAVQGIQQTLELEKMRASELEEKEKNRASEVEEIAKNSQITIQKLHIGRAKDVGNLLQQLDQQTGRADRLEKTAKVLQMEVERLWRTLERVELAGETKAHIVRLHSLLDGQIDIGEEAVRSLESRLEEQKVKIHELEKVANDARAHAHRLQSRLAGQEESDPPVAKAWDVLCLLSDQYCDD